MKKYILAVMLVIMARSIAIAGYGDVPSYEQKPHLEIKCTCGASFITYEWLKETLLQRVDKFLEIHPCSHDTKLASLVTHGWSPVFIPAPLREKKKERLFVRELIGSETAGFILSNWTSSYRCVVCGESLTTVYNSNGIWYCSGCKKYFNIEKGE